MADTARTPVSKPSTRAVRLDEEQQDAKLVMRGELNSKQVEDPFKRFYSTGTGDLNIVEPPLNLVALLRMTQENAMLRQCIEALVTNVEGHGYRMVFTGEDGQEESDPAKKELEALESFFEAPNDSYSLVELRTRCRWDLETLGNAYIEVARNQKGEITAFWHVPAQLMRLTNTDLDPTKVTAKLPRKTGVIEQSIQKYFRRFVQIVGTQRVYFKEFGDPRKIDPKSGMQKDELGHEETATEIIHLKLYNPGSIYGVPRWITQAPSIKGSRQAELTNLEYFSDNAIPAMVIMVSGGTVDQTSIDAVEEHIQSARGRKAQNRIVVLEARGDEHAAAENGTIAPPRIELKSLHGDRQGDALFQNYEKDCHTKVRSAFRLPPIFVGLAEDYTYATAKASFDVAESQVFGPERAIMDDMINRKILATWDVRHWKFRSNPPRITDPQEMLNAIETFNLVGAMNPNTAIGLANELFSLDIPMIEEDWGNWPFEMIKALGSAGRLEGMDEIVKEIDSTIDPSTGQPISNTPGETATPYTGKGGGKGKPDNAEDAKTKAQKIVSKALIDLRTALTHPVAPQETVPETVEVVRGDGTIAKVRHRARS